MYPSDLTDDEWATLKPLFTGPGCDTPKMSDHVTGVSSEYYETP
ncbi:hypothetical protein [Endozoicomonas sp. GU-1]|nr:hypothetical protein [Endozoicomonas sp. GU-1]WBA82732.1 hypothetical protein O2T12_06245 [Endozoicomonas sp. GU-1]WBA85662.1 hypothetical protein O3276_20890 [Endozoicomonas sp. GU-1]